MWPKYDESRVTSRLSQIDRCHWLVDRKLLMPKYEAWFRRIITISRATATTRIEGASMNETQVANLLRRPAKASFTDDEFANLGALRAYEFIDYLSDLPEDNANELGIREINRNVLFGAGELKTPGMYRNGQNYVGDPAKYTPPDQGDVPDLMRELDVWLREGSAHLHPVVCTGLAHLQFVAIHPFWDGNGRTARGFSTLMLQRSTCHFRKLLSIENTLSHLKDQYFSAIEQSLGDRYRSDYDATPFLEFFALAVATDALGLEGRLTDWHRQIDDLQRTFEGTLRQRQIEALLFAAQTGKVTRGDYMQIAQVSHMTASRDLKELVQTGLLAPEGETRSRVYRWTGQAATAAHAPENESAQPRLIEDKVATKRST